MSTLYLCEKPSQGRDIARVLGATQKGRGYIGGHNLVVTWCIGHLLEQAAPEAYDPDWQRWELATLPMLPTQWRVEVRKDGKGQFACIRQLLNSATRVVLATDADREGETIGREVLQLCGFRGPVQRLWLSALDDVSIRKALNDLLPGEKTEPLYQAGLGRSRADWLVGLNLTRAYTLLGRQSGATGVLSVGRVQTPTLKLVVDRDRAIAAFIPQPYFTVTAECVNADHSQFTAQWLPEHSSVPRDTEGRCTSAEAARTVAQSMTGKPATVRSTRTERKREAPPLPFDLSTLQQEASGCFGLDAQETLRAAQALYETHKATTYPRTDCGYLPLSQLAEAPAVLTALAQCDPSIAPLVEKADPTRQSRAWNDARITAHHGIVPTSARVNLNAMSSAERTLYALIRGRYLAQFFPEFVYDQTVVDLACQGHRLRAHGRKIREPGWRVVIKELRKADGIATDEDADGQHQPLPSLQERDSIQVREARFHSKATQPPRPFASGTLIAAMKSVGKFIDDPKLKAILRETSGIGTEATRAAIIETLLNRGLIEEKRKALISTETGRALIDAVPPEVADPATTALWEQALDDIAKGRGDLRQFIARQSQFVTALIERARSSVVRVAPSVSAPTHSCPQCGEPLRRRKGRNGYFWGCTAYPSCTATLPDARGKPSTKRHSRTGHGLQSPRAGRRRSSR